MNRAAIEEAPEERTRRQARERAKRYYQRHAKRIRPAKREYQRKKYSSRKERFYRELGEASTWPELADILARYRRENNITQSELDWIAGHCDGLTGKLEIGMERAPATGRNPGRWSMEKHLRGLNVTLVVRAYGPPPRKPA